jgi:hypothetical protein
LPYPLFKPCLAFAVLASTALAIALARADDDDVHFQPGAGPSAAEPRRL